MTSGGALIADSGATVEGPMPAVSSVLMAYPVRPAACCWKMAAALRLMPGTGQQHHCRTSWNTDAGCRGSLSGRTQLSKGASMVLNGDVVSTGDIVNAGEIYFDNQTTPDAVLSRAVAKATPR